MYWVSKLDKLPPNVCRLLARVPNKPKAPLTTEQISQRSGLSKQTVRRISRLRSWATVPLETHEKFKIGCGITPGRECLQVAYLKRTFDPTKTRTSLFHVRKLMRTRHDKRLVAYFANLMKPKET